MPLYGKLADRLGRRLAFGVGVTLFLATMYLTIDNQGVD